MIRLIGILTGSAIAIAFLIIALGVPEFAAPEATDPAITEPMKRVVYVPVPEPDTDTPTAAEPAAVPRAESPAATDLVATAMPDAMPEEAVFEAAVPTQATPDTSDQQWYAFWSPFRSEIAADGFVSQLQRTTGLDYRVVKLKPGVYEVAFAYSDDSDIQDKLTQISSATGLDLSGG